MYLICIHVSFHAVFKFPLINFCSFSEIPLRLLVSVAVAFQERHEVCRKCFYGERSLSYSEGLVCGEAQHVWDKPILVIPGNGLSETESESG